MRHLREGRDRAEAARSQEHAHAQQDHQMRGQGLREEVPHRRGTQAVSNGVEIVSTNTLQGPQLTTTGCPEDGSNFDTPLFSGIVGHIRLIFGVFKEWMCGFNYMYRT